MNYEFGMKNQHSAFSIQHFRRGSVLLLALLILSAVLAATTAVSTLVVREIRLNKQIDDAVIAYYAAESGIEKGLWQISVTPLSGVVATQPTTTSLSNNVRVTLQTKNVGTTIDLPFFALAKSLIQRKASEFPRVTLTSIGI